MFISFYDGQVINSAYHQSPSHKMLTLCIDCELFIFIKYLGPSKERLKSSQQQLAGSFN